MAVDCLTCGFVHGVDTPHEHVDLPWSDASTPTRNGSRGRRARNPDPSPSVRRRGRTNDRAGKDLERWVARAYGVTVPEGESRRTGMYGGPDDALVGDLFVVQCKVRGGVRFPTWAWDLLAAGAQSTLIRVGRRYPGWAWDELAKLPRGASRVPTLIVSDWPRIGEHARRLVFRTVSDDRDLNGIRPAAGPRLIVSDLDERRIVIRRVSDDLAWHGRPRP